MPSKVWMLLMWRFRWWYDLRTLPALRSTIPFCWERSISLVKGSGGIVLCCIFAGIDIWFSLPLKSIFFPLKQAIFQLLGMAVSWRLAEGNAVICRAGEIRRSKSLAGWGGRQRFMLRFYWLDSCHFSTDQVLKSFPIKDTFEFSAALLFSCFYEVHRFPMPQQQLRFTHRQRVVQIKLDIRCPASLGE